MGTKRLSGSEPLGAITRNSLPWVLLLLARSVYSYGIMGEPIPITNSRLFSDSIISLYDLHWKT